MITAIVIDYTALKKSYLLYVRFTYICMDIQRVPNPLFLIWRSKGSLIISNQLVLSPIFLALKTITIQYCDKQSALYVFQKSFLRRLYELVLVTNVSLRISGDRPWWILNISVAKTYTFLWCIETVAFI